MTGEMYEIEEVVRGRTEIRFSSLFRRETEYAIEHIYAYHKYALLSHLRYDVFRDGEFIGQEAEYECALRLVAVDFAYRLWRGPLGVILRDEDRLEELVWWFVREIPEERGNVNIVTNAYHLTETPERKPDPPKRGSSVEKGARKKGKEDVASQFMNDVLEKTFEKLKAAGLSEDQAIQAMQSFFAGCGWDVRREPDGVKTVSAVTHKIIR